MQDIDLEDVCATEIVIREQSFYPSTVEFKVPVRHNLDAPYAKYGELRVWHHGHVVLIGPVTSCDPSLDAAGDEAWTVVVSDRWYWLETCTYVTELRKAGEAGGSKLLVPMCVPGGRYVMVDPGHYAPNPDASSDDPVTPTIAMGAAFSDIIANSNHLHSRLVLDFAHEQEMISFETSLSYLAELMRAVQQWRPGLTTYFDYSSPDDPALVITDKGEVVSLDAATDEIGSINLASRPDLIPPAVGVIGLSAQGNRSIAYTMAAWPPDAADQFKAPGALLLSVSLPAGTETDAAHPSRGAFPNALINMTPEEARELLGIPEVMTPAETATDVLPRVANMLKYNAAREVLRGKKFPDKAEDWADWWMQKAPQLFGGKQIKTTRPPKKEPTTPDAIYSNHVSENLDYEWVSGQYNGVGKGVKWTALKIEQEIYINDPPDELKSRFPTYVGNNTYMGKVACYVHALGHAYKSYALDPDGTELPDEGIEEAPIEPEEESSGDPRPEPGATEAIPRYDDVVREVWEARQKLEYEGTVKVYRCRHAIRPGCKVNLMHAGRLEWEGMQATVQTVETDPETGDVSLELGPASHISLQTAAERARAMSGRVNRAVSNTDDLVNTLNVQYTKPDDTEAPGPDPDPGGSSTTITYPPRQRPTAPEVGPCFRLLDGTSGRVDIAAEFSVRAKWDEAGDEITGCEWYGGKVYGPRGSIDVGVQNEWNASIVTNGSLYCNIEVDAEGNISSAKVDSTPAGDAEGKIWAGGFKGYSGEEYRPSGDGWDGEAMKVSVKIADVRKSGVVHHRLGSISVPVAPKYVLFECRDYVEEDSPASDDVSLIADKTERYALLKRLMPGKEIKFGGISEADPPKGFLKINARQVKVETVPQEAGSTVAPGTSLFDQEAMTKQQEKDEANWERTLMLRSIRAMESADYDRYDGGEPNGTRCRVVIDLRDGVLLVGAYSGTMTDPP